MKEEKSKIIWFSGKEYLKRQKEIQNLASDPDSLKPHIIKIIEDPNSSPMDLHIANSFIRTYKEAVLEATTSIRNNS